MTPARVRKFAVSLANAREAPHMARVAFRTPRRIFATMAGDGAGDGADVNLMFDADLQAHYCAMAPEAFAPVPGGWGRMGATRCDLKIVDKATFRSALAAAHARANAPLPKRKSTK